MISAPLFLDVVHFRTNFHNALLSWNTQGQKTIRLQAVYQSVGGLNPVKSHWGPHGTGATFNGSSHLLLVPLSAAGLTSDPVCKLFGPRQIKYLGAHASCTY